MLPRSANSSEPLQLNETIDQELEMSWSIRHDRHPRLVDGETDLVVPGALGSPKTVPDKTTPSAWLMLEVNGNECFREI